MSLVPSSKKSVIHRRPNEHRTVAVEIGFEVVERLQHVAEALKL
jgi:hypothetical protein